MKIRALILLFVLFIAYYYAMDFIKKNEEQLSTNNLKEQVEIKSGDLVFRKENSIISQMFSKIDDSFYSHLAVALNIDGAVKLYHIEATEDEEDLKIESVAEFAKNAEKLAVYRYKQIENSDANSDKKRVDEVKLKEILDEFEKNKPKFDFDFSLENENLYCTEFINEVFLKLNEKAIYSYLYDFYGKKGITINSILLNPELEKRYEIEF